MFWNTLCLLKKCIVMQDHRKIFYGGWRGGGGGPLSKSLSHHGQPTTKRFKKALAKCPKVVPQKTKFRPKYK